jgi:phage virion morphogenesis protein
MTAAVFEAVLDDSLVLGALDRLAAAAADSGPLLRIIGDYGVDTTKRRFEAQAAPDGTPWAALNSAYAAMKPSGYNILFLSGALLNSQHWVAGIGEVKWGSGMIYAAAHQWGAVITPKTAKALVFKTGLGGAQTVRVQSVTLPARPYLGLSAEDRIEIPLLAQDYLIRAMRG